MFITTTKCFSLCNWTMFGLPLVFHSNIQPSSIYFTFIFHSFSNPRLFMSNPLAFVFYSASSKASIYLPIIFHLPSFHLPLFHCSSIHIQLSSFHLPLIFHIQPSFFHSSSIYLHFICYSSSISNSTIFYLSSTHLPILLNPYPTHFM